MAKLDMTQAIFRDLHPVGLQAFKNLTVRLENAWRDEKTRTYFRPFEGHRSPAKQLELGMKRPPVTLAGPWQSAHQYGLAVDFVAWNGQAWNWDEDQDWAFLKTTAEECGLLRPIDWDKAHIEHPLFAEMMKIQRKWLGKL